MRCPKCGYISFDNQDNCKKCRKPVKLDEVLEGLIFAIQPPVFLGLNSGSDRGIGSNRIGPGKVEKKESIVEVSMDGEEEQDLTEIEIDFGEEDDQQFSLEFDDNESDIKELDILEDDFARATIDFDASSLDEDREEEQVENDIQLDFTNIDISDLAPPQEKKIGDIDDDIDIIFTESEPSPVTEQKSESNLDDLLFEGLDLDTPAPPVAGSKSAHMLTPSLKTGTALDDFEVDLGEFIIDEK